MRMLAPHRLALGVLRRLRRRWCPSRFDRILAVHGWTHEGQLRFLMDRVRQAPDGARIVEVGVWQGRSALAMAEACRGTGKRVFAVDPWQDYDEGGGDVSTRLGRWGLASFDEVYERFRSNTAALGLEPWVETVRAPSLDAARDWRHGPIATIFIDGSHDYDSVLRDLAAWTPLVGADGVVAGDDWNWDTVRRAVTDFVTREGLPAPWSPCDNTWAFVKPAR
ncbi:MAG: class I SAM-dependent methyltransferase [Candidatus Rokubacteria bacterium]|nr:class I SAM-dependent methyltransferase [Candidatus Rokubacteria bacterium]